MCVLVGRFNKCIICSGVGVVAAVVYMNALL